MVIKAGYAVVKPTHEYHSKSKHTYWEYIPSKQNGIDYIKFNWIVEPEFKINEEIGTALYKADIRKEMLCHRYYKAKHILYTQLTNVIRNRDKKYREGDLIKLFINNREFLFEVVSDGWSLSYKLLHSPYGKEIYEINLDD
jgi:hypothetical protein